MRETQVYVGVDVFGRGCLGGGGFDSKIAVKFLFTGFSSFCFSSNEIILMLKNKGGSSLQLRLLSGSVCPRMDVGVRKQPWQRLP